MKRSEINRHIEDMLDFARRRQFPLPPWACFTPAQWAAVGPEADEVRRCGLGWDITDFGSGEFARTGLTLFTVRNGRPGADGPAAKAWFVPCLHSVFFRVIHIHPCNPRCSSSPETEYLRHSSSFRSYVRSRSAGDSGWPERSDRYAASIVAIVSRAARPEQS